MVQTETRPLVETKKQQNSTPTVVGLLSGVLGPAQTINVWRLNTIMIKHCLVTKHANVEVSGQTVKTCLIKHR